MTYHCILIGFLLLIGSAYCEDLYFESYDSTSRIEVGDVVKGDLRCEQCDLAALLSDANYQLTKSFLLLNDHNLTPSNTAKVQLLYVKPFDEHPIKHKDMTLYLSKGLDFENSVEPGEQQGFQFFGFESKQSWKAWFHNNLWPAIFLLIGIWLVIKRLLVPHLIQKKEKRLIRQKIFELARKIQSANERKTLEQLYHDLQWFLKWINEQPISDGSSDIKSFLNQLDQVQYKKQWSDDDFARILAMARKAAVVVESRL